MLDPEEIRRKLDDAKLTSVSKNSGVRYNLLCRFMKGYDARGSVLKKLTDYLESKENAK